MTEGDWERVEVGCYSSYIYARRPLYFLREGKRHEVEEVESEWIEPGERCFRVLTAAGERFELRYREGEDIWLLRGAPGDGGDTA